MKGCMRHYAKWQIHPFLFKGANIYLYCLVVKYSLHEEQHPIFIHYVSLYSSWDIISKDKTLKQGLYNVGPTLQTAAQH